MDEPQARVEVGPDGQLILIDPVAASVALAVAKHNCRNTLALSADRVDYFRQRAVQLGQGPKEVVIVVINVDDKAGEILAEALMPGFNWDEIRAKGETPVARGLAGRDGVIEFAKKIDPNLVVDDNPSELQVVVVDHSTCEIF